LQEDAALVERTAKVVVSTTKPKTTEEVEGDTKEEPKEEIARAPRRLFELIDEVPIEITPKDPQPIAFFSQDFKAQRYEGFTFAGYFIINHIALLAAHLQELTRMLEQKWSISDEYGNMQTAKRGQKQWEESLSYE
jgi:hypothetical protein